ncbi:MAG: ATP-dependent 6-phosphofructokinase [Bacteroidota bacterium]
MKKVLILTGGGDCPGLNAVIRAIARRAAQEGGWKVYGSLEAYHGVMRDPVEIMEMTPALTEEIHRLGGTIIKATTQGDPRSFPVKQPDGTVVEKNITDDLVEKIHQLGFEAVISIGGDGSQKISQMLFERGVNIIGVPKTIDNDLSATDFTFGFQTAVQEATDAIDRLVSTAKSHNRVIILELMGRDAGWIALYSAIAGGAHVCLIPEIPYDAQKVVDHIHRQYQGDSGYAIVVVAEGARSRQGVVTDQASTEVGYKMRRLGGVAFQLSGELKACGCRPAMREMILGHLQRGGSPVAFDRVLSTSFGVKAFEMVLNKAYGRLVVYRNNRFDTVTLEEATKEYKAIDRQDYLLEVARGVGISLGD